MMILSSHSHDLITSRAILLSSSTGSSIHLSHGGFRRRHGEKHDGKNAFYVPKKHVNVRVRASLQLSDSSTDRRRRSTVSNCRCVVDGDEISVTGIVTVKLTIKDILLDFESESTGETLALWLVSSQLDPETGCEKEAVKAIAHKVSDELIIGEAKYEAIFIVPKGFGEIGAVMVENPNDTEMFISNIVLKGLPDGPVSFVSDSWVEPRKDCPVKRVFFSEKSYLPSKTPDGLKRIREEELKNLRGNGRGERKKFERIYDYDAYNDLGDPDKDKDLTRPVLGSKEHPYPRRCRTGRPHCKTDPCAESRNVGFYVPRDEAFSELKQLDFGLNLLKSVLHSLIPSLEARVDPNEGFSNFSAIDNLFQFGLSLPKLKGGLPYQHVIPRLIKAISNVAETLLKFEVPELIERDELSWLSDEEFARQFLAGLNPYSIKLVTEWPLKSELSSEIYGPPESLITKELVEEEINGSCMTLELALMEKRLFIVDYHDLFLPYVNKINEIDGSVIYGSRTLLFKKDDDTLQLLAIELTRPPVGKKPQWKQVFRPSYDSTGSWLWRLAKTHVATVDAGYHQLISHWLRTHCCTEPYIIACNRQLSAMHPVYRLLKPHFRYTMEINAQARKSLINAGGIIETTFTPDKYSMELSSAVYDKVWRFDKEAFPADLIRRGMAVEDPTSRHGLKLTIEDYPFASDGLILWDAIKEWVTEYVNHYYPETEMVYFDTELQAWWTEVRTKGHADKKDEPWWPVLNTQDDLIQVLCTIIWVSSGHHAAVNFGQYPYGGYFPNHPTRARATMPSEDPEGEDYKEFLDKPVSTLMKTLPSILQATKVMTIYDILSSHSVDEEYIGEKAEASWKKDPVISAAFAVFTARLTELEAIIKERNINMNLKNRTGAGIVPYELLKPRSGPGVTGKGVPNSISI